MKRIAAIIAVSLIAWFPVAGSMRPVLCEERTPLLVRILIANDVESAGLRIQGYYRIYDLYTHLLLGKGPALKAQVTSEPNGITVDTERFGSRAIRIQPVDDAQVYVNDRKLRGELVILSADDSKKLAVINYLDVEDYLCGVLYHEVSHRWPIEALKAQAITSRTFALYQRKINKTRPYDMGSDIYSQVYGGKASERWSTNRAVRQTEGQVLTYRGELFPAYFHATCAGSTEDSSNLWNIQLLPLGGVECEFCKQSPYFEWTKRIPLGDITKNLQNEGYKVGEIRIITVASTNRSGRIDRLKIEDTAGVVTLMTAKDFRQIMGPNEIRSTRFFVTIEGQDAVFKGSGWGHGVGLCQWGAFGMSKKGYTAQQILGYYYPGSAIATVDSVKGM